MSQKITNLVDTTIQNKCRQCCLETPLAWTSSLWAQLIMDHAPDDVNLHMWLYTFIHLVLQSPIDKIVVLC